MKNFEDVISELKKTVSTYEEQGITVQPLNNVINDLDRHSQNIKIIESNIDAIREEVIDKIKTELDENKKAGRFSIAGAYLGAIGLFFSIISIGFTLYEKVNPQILDTSKISELSRSVQSINTRLASIVPAYTPKKGEIELSYWDKVTILESEKGLVQFELEATSEGTIPDKVIPFSRISVYLNSRQLGNKGLNEIISISGKYKLPRIENSYIQLIENDELILFGKHRFKVKKVLSKSANERAIGDDKNAVYLQAD